MSQKMQFLVFFYNLFTLAFVDVEAIATDRYSPFSSNFHNPYDYVDAEAYGTNLFFKLLAHMSEVKRDKHKCPNIPVPKTILNQKYFNPKYEFMDYKFWYPPKEHQYVLMWSQNEAYRSSLFLSYMLQNDNAKFPPGIYTFVNKSIFKTREYILC